MRPDFDDDASERATGGPAMWVHRLQTRLREGGAATIYVHGPQPARAHIELFLERDRLRTALGMARHLVERFADEPLYHIPIDSLPDELRRHAIPLHTTDIEFQTPQSPAPDDRWEAWRPWPTDLSDSEYFKICISTHDPYLIAAAMNSGAAIEGDGWTDGDIRIARDPYDNHPVPGLAERLMVLEAERHALVPGPPLFNHLEDCIREHDYETAVDIGLLSEPLNTGPSTEDMLVEHLATALARGDLTISPRRLEELAWLHDKSMNGSILTFIESACPEATAGFYSWILDDELIEDIAVHGLECGDTRWPEHLADVQVPLREVLPYAIGILMQSNPISVLPLLAEHPTLINNPIEAMTRAIASAVKHLEDRRRDYYDYSDRMAHGELVTQILRTERWQDLVDAMDRADCNWDRVVSFDFLSGSDDEDEE